MFIFLLVWLITVHALYSSTIWLWLLSIDNIVKIGALSKYCFNLHVVAAVMGLSLALLNQLLLRE